MTQTPVATDDPIRNAIGVIAFLQSMLRSGETLSKDEEAVVQQTIDRLNAFRLKLAGMFEIVLPAIATPDEIAEYRARLERER